MISKLERITVTLPAHLVEDIDRAERNRSRFILTAVEHELAARRREALMRSLRNPHPESVSMAEEGMADWLAGLPEEEGLVDPGEGTGVRWVEGQGWVEER